MTKPIRLAKQSRTGTNNLPVVNLSALSHSDIRVQQRAAREIGEIAETTGFLYLAQHGIDPHLVDRVYRQSSLFFAQSDQEKQRYYVGHSKNHRGYVPTTEKGSYDDEVGPRRYEAFDMALDLPEDDTDYLSGNPLLGPNVWPTLQNFRRDLSEYYAEMRRLERVMCYAFELYLGISPGYFQKFMQRPVSQLRLIHYLPATTPAEDIDVNMGAHTDYECFTILHSYTDGLEILDLNNQWIKAPPIENTFYFNIGDMLEVWSNGRFKSTPHRVVNFEERYSIPYFAATDFDAVINPLVDLDAEAKISRKIKYQPIVAGQHLLGQMLRDFPYLNRRFQSGDLNVSGVTPGQNPFEARIRSVRTT
ncbi:MAG: 2-oxoglutarate and iron-dependent oxygenase domain-containing protein [Pseudomonadota bacterium]